MKNKMMIILIVLAVLLIGTGVVVYKLVIQKPVPKTATQTNPMGLEDTLPQADTSIKVNLTQSSSKANTVVLTATGLGGKYANVGYELSYQSNGLFKGVTSGSTPIDTSGQDTFTREVYLGTCSKNDCRPDTGVTKISVVLKFTDSSGKQSEFSKDYSLDGSAASGSSSGSTTPTPPED